MVTKGRKKSALSKSYFVLTQPQSHETAFSVVCPLFYPVSSSTFFLVMSNQNFVLSDHDGDLGPVYMEVGDPR